MSDSLKIITDERCMDYSSPGHPERPARIKGTLAQLKSQKEITLEWLAPDKVETRHLLLAHSDHLISRVDAEDAFDGDTPAYPKIGEHARRGVGGALHSMRLARKGEKALSLLRPPGHHATQDRAMGFCYFNSIAIAALQALQEGAKKVALYDFDVHHGNGTEAILLNHPQITFTSIHQFPCYPGTGQKDLGKNCFNYPVAPGLDRKDYRKVLEQALERTVQQKPDLIGVSAGFDAYARDPLAQMTLEAEDYQWLGEKFRKTGLPVFSVLEGGYSDDLPQLVQAYLRGFI